MGTEDKAGKSIEQPHTMWRGVDPRHACEEEGVVSRWAEDRTPEKDTPLPVVPDAPHTPTRCEDPLPEPVIGSRRRVVEQDNFEVKPRCVDDQHRLECVQEIRRRMKDVASLIPFTCNKKYGVLDHLIVDPPRCALPAAVTCEDVLEVLTREEIELEPRRPAQQPARPLALT
jgi:hypothetical protein